MHLCIVAYVIGSVLTNVLLLLWFRLLRVPIFSLVTLNYFVCVAVAASLSPPTLAPLLAVPLWGKLILLALGGLFIGVFALTGVATQQVGVGLTGMLAKLSVIFPVGFAAAFLGEAVSGPQLIGIAFGVGAIVVVHVPYLRGGGWRRLLQAARVGLLLWLGNGVIDILFKVAQPAWQNLPTLQVPLIIMSIAGLIGLAQHFVRSLAMHLRLGRVWIAALLLGLTNIASVFFYLEALKALPAVQFFLWNNLGIVLLSGLAGVVFFRERLSWEVGLGYVLGGAAIWLVGLA